MHNLLSEMTKVPASIRYFLLLITLLICLFGYLISRHEKNHPYRQNPYVIPLATLLGTALLTIVITSIREGYVRNNTQNYAVVTKESNHITIHSESIFIEDKTLPIKRQVEDINIVEYNGNDYVIYDNELRTK